MPLICALQTGHLDSTGIHYEQHSKWPHGNVIIHAIASKHILQVSCFSIVCYLICPGIPTILFQLFFNFFYSCNNGNSRYLCPYILLYQWFNSRINDILIWTIQSCYTLKHRNHYIIFITFFRNPINISFSFTLNDMSSLGAC
jgi:hypothetical protein